MIFSLIIRAPQTFKVNLSNLLFFHALCPWGFGTVFSCLHDKFIKNAVVVFVYHAKTEQQSLTFYVVKRAF